MPLPSSARPLTVMPQTPRTAPSTPPVDTVEIGPMLMPPSGRESLLAWLDQEIIRQAAVDPASSPQEPPRPQSPTPRAMSERAGAATPSPDGSIVRGGSDAAAVKADSDLGSSESSHYSTLYG